MSINGYKINTTPFLASYKNMINLGIASSTANCSATSNILLQSGLQLKDLPDKENKALKMANIFQYAKKAGFKTAYVSNQSFKDKLQNFMTKYDLNYIDYFYQPDLHIDKNKENIPEENIIKNVKLLLNKNDKNFIYIVKAGCHFHYESSYPNSKRIFKPTLNDAEPISFDKKQKMLNSYCNCIRWKVDKFFEYFFKNISLDDNTIIFYTSDHGQSILENGVLNTHCTAHNPPKTQGIVPIVIFTKNNGIKQLVVKNKDKLNSYAIFPTIISFIGYKIHMKTFFDNFSKKEQVFVSGDIFGTGKMEKNNINEK